MGSPKYRSIHIYGPYFTDFVKRQTIKVQEKIDWILELLATVDRIPSIYLKHLEGTDGLYEIRVQSGGDIFRIFCFFDQGKLIVVINGCQKKTRKTPRNEIKTAQKIKEEYYANKK